MRIRPLIIGGLTLATALPLFAQEQAKTDSLPLFMRRRIEAIMGIPRRAEEIRKAGVPDSTVRGVLDVLTKEKVPADEAEEVLTAHRDAAKENGPTDNFGAFVQQQLAAGHRGRELAAAIRAEHQARGKGHGNHGGPGAGDDAARGKRPEGAGGGRPDDAGRGRPEGAGRGGRAGEPSMKRAAPADSAAGKRPAGPPAKGKKPN